LDLGWLSQLDPRIAADEDFQGCEIVDAAALNVLQHAHEGRIRGRLHERLHVWKQYTDDISILRIIEHGHEIPLRSWPEAHHDSNNYVTTIRAERK